MPEASNLEDAPTSSSGAVDRSSSTLANARAAIRSSQWELGFDALAALDTSQLLSAAARSGREAELQSELEALFDEHNVGGSGAPTSILATYLRVTVSP